MNGAAVIQPSPIPFYTVLVLYLGIMAFIGWYAGRKTNNIGDFFVLSGKAGVVAVSYTHLKQNFNIPYTTIKLSGGNNLMYNSSQICVMNSRGVQKYMGSVDGTIKDFFKIGWNRYLLVLDSGVDVIKLG